MLWFAVWVVLLLSAALVFFLLGRDLWRKARALTADLAVATDRLDRARRPARIARGGHVAGEP